MTKNHSHAFFVYGVVVGLAIREALLKVVPHALPGLMESAAVTSGTVPAADSTRQIVLETARLVTFLIVLIRFYIGAGVYFDRVYCSEETACNFSRKSYGLDFLLGTIHFIILFVWSQTIVVHNRIGHGISTFLVLLGVVLLYDLLWWALSADYDSVFVIRRWAIFNAATAAVSLLLILIWDTWSLSTDTTAEIIALAPVLLVSIVDFGEMFGGKNALTSKILEWFR